jgi:anti-anti-sigma factor
MTDWTKLEVERVEIGETRILVYRLKGALTGSTQSQAFLLQVQKDCKKEPRKVIVNMKSVQHLDSSGSGILTASFTSVTNAGGRMCLVGLSTRAEAVLNVIRFLYIVGHTQTEEEAVAYLTK